MQEIKHNGSEGVYKEGDLKELLPEIETSMKKKNVKQVVVSKIPGRKKLGGISEDRIREIVREEFKILILQQDKTFKKILKEIEVEK